MFEGVRICNKESDHPFLTPMLNNIANLITSCETEYTSGSSFRLFGKTRKRKELYVGVSVYFSLEGTNVS